MATPFKTYAWHGTPVGKVHTAMETFDAVLGLVQSNPIQRVTLDDPVQFVQAMRAQAKRDAEEIETAAWLYVDPGRKLDWSLPENIEFFAVQRAAFKAGIRAAREMDGE